MKRIPPNRIAVQSHPDPHNAGVFYRKLVRKSWGKLQRSCDAGLTWHDTSSAAYWAAFHTGSLTPMTRKEIDYLNAGNVILA